MPYSKTTWVDGSTPAIDAANLNNIETGISKAPYGPDASTNNVPIWNGTGWTYATIGASQITAGAISNAQVNAAAAIAYSKLALTGSILNADLAGSISGSKLVSGSSNIPAGTSFPGSPSDGDEYVYAADATNGVYWRFKWIAANSKWRFIGGPPLYAEVATVETTASTSYADLATTGPAIALPFAGDFDVAIGVTPFDTTNSATCDMSYAIGATTASDNDLVRASQASGVQGAAISVMRQRRKTGLTAVTLTAKYKVDLGTGSFGRRWMSVLPVQK